MGSEQRAGGTMASFATVTTLFFTWGFITSSIDPLIASVRGIFSLSYTEALLTQSAFFAAYGILSLPGGMIVARAGYPASILGSLLVMLGGCLFIPIATSLDRYALVLVGLFIIGGGITVLQVAANPLAAALGSPERSAFRLTLSQGFNSLGTVIGPYFGTELMLRGGLFAQTGGGAAGSALRTQSLRSIDRAFFIVAALVVLLVAFIWTQRRRLAAAAPDDSGAPAGRALAALGSFWAVLGAATIFLYVGAEVSIGSLMINFLHQPAILDVPFDEAGRLLSLYWLGAMIGRFAGSALMTRFPAYHLLAITGLGAGLLCILVATASGPVAAVAALSVGLMNSIMFPAIFALTLERSSAPTPATSGLLGVAIVGGAILPRLAGLVADRDGLQAAYVVPLAAYAVITLFAISAGRVRPTSPAAPGGPASSSSSGVRS